MYTINIKYLNMKKIASFISLLLVLSIPLMSQEREVEESYRPIQFFIGIQPRVDYEQVDEIRKTFDISIVPVQLEYAINNKWSIRLSPNIFMQFRPEFPRELSRVGAGLTIPYHFSKKNSEEGHRGFYVGPHAAITMYRLDNFISTTLAGELGYYFLFNSILSFNVGVQAGRTLRIDPDNSYNLLYNHTAAVFAFGIWF